MGVVVRYSTLILASSPTNCGVHLAESPFQTRFGMYQKIIFAIRIPYFAVYFSEFDCHSSLRQPHPGQSPTNCDVHLAESFLNMLWKYRKNRKSIKYNKLSLQKQKTSELYYTISKFLFCFEDISITLFLEECTNLLKKRFYILNMWKMLGT
ncbi:MAG: DUF6783 domain-containing protein [Ruminococcus sp.]